MELANRAYAAFEVRAVNDGKRTFKGWATTPALDRIGDTINPLGVKFRNPLALLHHHWHDRPIGTVNFGKPSAKGIQFDAEMPVISEEFPTLRDRVDTAWGELKYGLVRAVSIGFRPLKYSFTDSGVDYDEIEVYELSTVTIPALPDAVITAVKAMHPRLSIDMIREIKRFDAIVKNGSVPLVQRKPNPVQKLEGGAVKLVKAG